MAEERRACQVREILKLKPVGQKKCFIGGCNYQCKRLLNHPVVAIQLYLLMVIQLQPTPRQGHVHCTPLQITHSVRNLEFGELMLLQSCLIMIDFNIIFIPQ